MIVTLFFGHAYFLVFLSLVVFFPFTYFWSLVLFVARVFDRTIFLWFGNFRLRNSFLSKMTIYWLALYVVSPDISLIDVLVKMTALPLYAIFTGLLNAVFGYGWIIPGETGSWRILARGLLVLVRKKCGSNMRLMEMIFGSGLEMVIPFLVSYLLSKLNRFLNDQSDRQL